MDKLIDKTALRLLKFLYLNQENNGSFPSVTTYNPKNFEIGTRCDSIFSTPLIALSLNTFSSDNIQARKIQQKAIKFLLKQRSENWSFNYWDRSSPSFKEMPYPDDLDDTFCSLAAIYQHDPKLIDGKAFACIISLLTALEAKEGGPYRTWLVPKSAPKVWRDIDLAVNSNIAYFLSLQEVSIPALNKLIDQSIRKGQYLSPYYPNSFPIIYFISRFYGGRQKERLRQYIMSQKKEDGSWNNNPLDTALAISSLINLNADVDLKKSISFLLNSVEKKNCEPYPFYTGINPGGERRKYYAGSASLTSAFCIEALNKYKQSKKTAAKENEFGLIKKIIIQQAEEQISEILPLRTAVKFVEKFLSRDIDDQITLLPAYFRGSIKRSREIDDNFVAQLGLANLFGWIAYTVYDDFIDKEGDRRLLPVANLCLQKLCKIFSQILPSESEFNTAFSRILTGIEKSNVWETRNCQFEGSDLSKIKSIPNYGDFLILAEKSLGHVLGPLAILHKLGFNRSSGEIRGVTNFIKYLLVARQLLDDAHDWEEDLRRGLINSVGSIILSRCQKSRSRELKFDNEKDLNQLREIFWREIAPDIFSTILRFVKKSEKALDSCQEVNDPKFLHGLLDRIKKNTEKAISDRAKTIDFLDEIKFSE